MPSVFPRVKDGQWFPIFRKGYKIICCDCGLTHSFKMKKKKGRWFLQAFRDEVCSANIRRAGYMKESLKRLGGLA